MDVVDARFVKSAVKPEHYPEYVLPEVAFVGRSNVGKSSMLNVLVNRKRLAKTGRTPGCTRLVNFFEINAGRANACSLVDLPGYGFARLPQAEQEAMRPMVEAYLSQRENLRGVVLVWDVRRDPGAPEADLFHWLRAHELGVGVVVTKCDKLKRNAVMTRMSKIRKALAMNTQQVVPFSSLTRDGREGAWALVDTLLARAAG